MAREIKSQDDLNAYNADPAGWEANNPDTNPQNTNTSGLGVPISSDQALQRDASLAARATQTADARKKQNFDINASKLASIFFREQNLSGGRQQQPDMLSQFLGL